MKEILGLGGIEAEVEFTESADTDAAVEFDCDGNSIPENVRRYMAESVLYLLDSTQLREGSGEVWIRQGQPETHRFNSL